MTKKLVLLTYNVLPGSDPEQYAEFTRTIDYGAFRQNPGVQSYANYVVTRHARGREWFQHFDLMFVDDLDNFHADGKLHFGDPLILDHAARWRRTWGQDSATGWRTDVNISYAEEISG